MEKVRIGVIGVGGMGSGHCAWMHEVEEAALAAVCDVAAPALAAATEKYDVPGFDNADALINSGLVDAVIIATPHYFHPPIAIAAFKAGLHVLSEKPIAVTGAAADEMIAAAKASGKVFGVMYQMRAAARNRLARQIIDSGRLGSIYRTSMVVGWYRSQAYYNSGGWRATWTGEGGGVLINQAPHFLDLFSWLGGLPVKLTGTTRTRIHDIEVEDEAFATLEYANGAHGYLYASTTETPGHEQIEICGDKGKIMIQGSTIRFWELPQPISDHVKAAPDMWSGPSVQEVPILSEAPEGGAPVEGPAPLILGDGKGGHTEITRAFCRRILFGEPLLAPGEEGLNAVELINGLILSSKTGKAVTLPVDRAQYTALLDELKRGSQGKSEVNEVRTTDPNFAK